MAINREGTEGEGVQRGRGRKCTEQDGEQRERGNRKEEGEREWVLKERGHRRRGGTERKRDRVYRGGSGT